MKDEFANGANVTLSLYSPELFVARGRNDNTLWRGDDEVSSSNVISPRDHCQVAAISISTILVLSWIVPVRLNIVPLYGVAEELVTRISGVGTAW